MNKKHKAEKTSKVTHTHKIARGENPLESNHKDFFAYQTTTNTYHIDYSPKTIDCCMKAI